MTTLLALDTSTEACSVALLHGGERWVRHEVVPRLHAQRVLPMVQAVLAEASLPLSSVEAIAFGRGPGAFTGVRIAAGVVQGLAFGLGCPVLPVSDLALLAQRAYREHGVAQVAAAIDARMDEVYWGTYRCEQGLMVLQGLEVVCPPEQVALPRSGGDECWFGAGTGWCYRDRCGVQVAECDAHLLPHADDLLTLGLAAWQRGEGLAPEQAQPIYLRDNVAKAKKISLPSLSQP